MCGEPISFQQGMKAMLQKCWVEHHPPGSSEVLQGSLELWIALGYWKLSLQHVRLSSFLLLPSLFSLCSMWVHSGMFFFSLGHPPLVKLVQVGFWHGQVELNSLCAAADFAVKLPAFTQKCRLGRGIWCSVSLIAAPAADRCLDHFRNWDVLEGECGTLLSRGLLCIRDWAALS